MASMVYSDRQWAIQNGNAPVYHRGSAEQGQRAQFQGVVVPINGISTRNNVAFQTNNHVPATYTSNNISQIDPRGFPPSQTVYPNNVSLVGVPHFQSSGNVSHAAAERRANAAPPLDYQLLLLSLAEDYLAAAHSEGSMVALLCREMEMQRYYKLIATGLGCLEVVLKVSTVHRKVASSLDLWS